MPNPIAYLMLMAWPFVSVILFLRLPLERAILWTILGGYMLLPPVAEFDLPLVPSMNKDSIAAVCAVLCCMFIARERVELWPRLWSARIFLALLLLCVVPTVITNREPLFYERWGGMGPIHLYTRIIPGMGLRDTLSLMLGQIIMLLPFFLARQFLSTEKGMRETLIAMGLAGLIYSVPSLLETVIAPVLNIWVYGFFQHDFGQMIRGSGYRPIVFLEHGLWLALFMASALMAAAGLSRSETGRDRLRWTGATVYLYLVLIACKSLAALVWGTLLSAVILVLPRRPQILVATLLALFAITYPMMRNLHMIPLDSVLDQAEAISVDRAESLAFRFSQEEGLLERAAEKPLFGWGGWGRNLLIDEDTGRSTSIVDGSWIIVFGTYGWLGYIGQIGLLCLPIFLLFWQVRRMKSDDISAFVTPIALVLAATLIDMLLNATLENITWICAGAVLGYVERLARPARAEGPKPLFGSGPIIGQRAPRDRPRTVL
ncbi:hypothetical protein ACFORG_11120 [Lutimaribacter marinistellae]|uniref:O-antigen ligase like membrane protein n=1 Tax=Lutimaribacter marinistellae TaxID=1820329 RepID=A0ABV7TGF8_9RHOB